MKGGGRPFGRACEELPGCRLEQDIVQEDAERLGVLLETMDPWQRLGISGAALAAYLRREDPALHRYAIRCGAELAGLICVRHPWLRGPYIELLGLAPRFQGRGLGSTILAWAEGEARRESRNLWVVTSAFNASARRFYAGLGFLEIGPIPGLVSADHEEILLRKTWE